MIELATEKNIGELAELIAEYNREKNPSKDLKSIYSDSMEQLNLCLADKDHHTIYMARASEGALKGYVVIHWIPFPMLLGFEAYISDLLVTRDSRGQGIGRALLDEAEKEAKAKDCCRLMLNNRRSSDAYKREFYSKTGFEERTYYSNFVKIL